MAFSLVSREFFQRQALHEHEFATASGRKSRGRLVMTISIVSLTSGLMLTIINPIAGLLLALLLTLPVFAYGYFRIYRPAVRSMAEHSQALASLKPEGQVTFLSKVYVPFYLIPYRTDPMVFDGLCAGERIPPLKLIYPPTDEIGSALADFERNAFDYNLLASGADVLSSRDLVRSDEKAIHRKFPESGVSEALVKLRRSTDCGNWGPPLTLEFSIHKGGSILLATIDRLLMNARHAPLRPTVELSYAANGARLLVTALKGIEAELVDRGLSDIVADWKARITSGLDPIEKLLARNLEQLRNFHSRFLGHTSAMILRQVCNQCVEERKKGGRGNWEEEYDLAQKVLQRFRSSLESTKSVRHEVESLIRNEIKADLTKVRLPNGTIEQFPLEARLSLPHLVWEGNWDRDQWSCEGDRKHAVDKPQELSAYSEVFAHTGGELWEELKRPVLERTSATGERLSTYKQRFKSQLLALAPYDQLLKQLETERLKIELASAEAEGARSAARAKGW